MSSPEALASDTYGLNFLTILLVGMRECIGFKTTSCACFSMFYKKEIANMIRYILALLILLPQVTLASSVLKKNKLYGIVSDQNDLNGLAGVSIFIPELQKGTLSQADGSYQLDALPNGSFTVQFSYMGYETVIKKLQLKDSDLNLNTNLVFTSVTTQDVVVSGGFPSSQHENPIKISVMSKQEFDRLLTPSLGQKLASIPGVDLISRSPGVSSPVIRGLSLNNLIFLNNGVRLENFQFSVDHPFLVNDQGVDHIEVIKGPASLLYGSDAMGGVINIVREKPAPANTIKADVSTEFYSVTKGFNRNIGVKGSRENWFWMFRANQQSHHDYKDGDGDYIPNTRFNSTGLQVGLGLLRSYGSFKIYYDYLSPKLGMTNEESIPLVKEGLSKNRFWYQDLSQHLVASRNRLFIGDFKLELNVAYQFNQRRLNGNPQSDIFRLVDMDLNTLTYDGKFYFPTSDGTEFLLGIQGMHQTNRNHEAPNRIIPDANIDDFSVFALYKKELKLWEWQLGLRYDTRALYVPEQEAGGHSHSEVETPEEHEEMVHINRRFNNLNASIGTTFHVSDDVLLRTNIASAYRVPNLAELSQHGMHGNRFEEGNVNLDPQKSIESDLGLHYHTQKHNIDLSLFYNRVYDFIYLAPTDEISPEGTGFVYKYGQQNAKLYGGELAVNVVPFRFLKFHSDYAMVISKFDNGGRLPFVPQHKLNNSLRFIFKGSKLLDSPFLNLSWKHVFNQNHPAMFETKTDAYNLFEIQMGTDLKLGKYKASLELSADNIFNEKYTDHLSTLKTFAYLNPGRNISLKLTVEL
ncbi:TonB-dependent receptor [Ancylomarina salipaludis]|uniref:TonB-dependent receptor n=1 Tax=Ancylomarina salipaludis TaxID=2501299 RepID=A0A4Q1JQE9_9BACT|nr:TonB-dependent receptor [Ancylomarina salipaludis]RXQ96627.1 TonB-dependent receptor [Ancylomarina salipaludis]